MSSSNCQVRYTLVDPKLEGLDLKLGTYGAAGFDLKAAQDGVIKRGERHLIKTNIRMAIPKGYYGRIAPRSGLALKYGLVVLAGVIDSDYRGEIGVILRNTGIEDFEFKYGDRIAQIIIERCFTNLTKVESLDDTDRGAGGFGSTGI
jgi:dUTP pyrophosphatase